MTTAAKPAPASTRLPALRAAPASFTGRNGLLIVVLAGYAAGLLLTATGTANDTWLAVAAGREVAHGLPSVDHLTLLAAGARWVDQQWLAQLLFYGAYRGGGLTLVVAMSATLAFIGIAGAAAVARWRGADMRATVWIAVLSTWPYVAQAEVARPQTLVYPMFVGVTWLLIRDSLRPSRRVLAVVPVLVVWANLHGSVLIGVSIVALHGALILRRRPSIGSALVCGALLSMFASPYAAGLPHYYHSTLLNPAFKLLNEWGPTTLTLETAPVFLLLLGAAYLYGRIGHLFTTTETMIVLVTAAAALHAIRFTSWFALAAVMILPRPLAGVRGTQPPPQQLNRLCGRISIATIALLVAATVVKGVAPYPTAASAAITSAAGTNSAVFASEGYGDWLLTVAPTLRGRIAFDSRFELLSATEIGRIQLAEAAGVGWRSLASRYPVFVLNDSDSPRLAANLSSAGYAPDYRHGAMVVLVRPEPR